MKCPKCGTTNGKSNKFCRECGVKIDTVVEQALEQINGAACAPDEVARGEQLFDVWQCYNAGNLDAALGMIRDIVKCSPDSTSAHGLLALIYERKAEAALTAGDKDTWTDLIKQSIAQRERIIDLNPDSTADRDMLETLRLTLAGQTKPPTRVSPFDIKAAFNAVPTQWKAAAGAFLAFLVLAIVLLPGGAKNDPVPARQVAHNDAPVRLDAVSTPVAAADAPQATDESQGRKLKIYTFPGPAEPAPSPSSLASSTKAPQSLPRPLRSVEPAKLPSLEGMDLKVIAPPKPAKQPGGNAPKPADDSATESIVITPARSVPTTEQPAAQLGDGSSMLAHAIDLHNQGRTQDAIDSAQRAVELFQTDAAAGKNATTAKRGAENARKLIRVWQQSGSGAGQ